MSGRERSNTVELTPHLLGRETGKVVEILGFLGVLVMGMVLFAMFAMFVSGETGSLTTRIVTFSLTAFVCWVFLAGIHLRTRERRITIDASSVTVKVRSRVWRRTRVRPLSEFLGLIRTVRRGERHVGGGEGSTFWEVVGVLLPLPLERVTRRTAYHCLMLHHRHGRRGGCRSPPS